MSAKYDAARIAWFAADEAYQAELARCYGRAAGDRRYQMADHSDPSCQAARMRFREAGEAYSNLALRGEG